MEHPATSVLGSRRLVLIGGVRCMRGVPEADQMHRILDRFARAREEHEKKQERGEATNPPHGAYGSRVVAKASATGDETQLRSAVAS